VDPREPWRLEDTEAQVHPEFFEMWLSLLREDWASLVIVPTDHAISTYPVTAPLAEIAKLNAFRVFDAQRVSVADGLKLGARLAQAASAGSRTIVILDSLMESLGSVSVANQANRALVVVQLGVSRSDSLQSTIGLVGRDKILGCALLH